MSDAEKKIIDDVINEAGLDKSEHDNFWGFDSMWLLFVLIMVAGFGFPSNGNNHSVYQQGKIDAYENILKGFE